MRVGKSMTETAVIDAGDMNEAMDENGNAGAAPTSWKELAHHNMLAVVNSNKDGPWYTQSENVKDAEERTKDHPDYDPSTLHIPPAEWNRLTPGMMRYWSIK